MRFNRKTFIPVLTNSVILVFLILINIPNARSTSEVRIKSETSTPYLLKLDLPQQIWNGRGEKIYFQLHNDDIQAELKTEGQDKTTVEIGKIQNLEIDLVLAGAEFNPPGFAIIPIIGDKEIKMDWQIIPLSAQDIQGSVWVYINTIHEGQAGGNSRELIFTRDIQIKNKMILGLKIGTLQWILFSIILLNLLFLAKLFSYPRIQRLTK